MAVNPFVKIGDAVYQGHLAAIGSKPEVTALVDIPQSPKGTKIPVSFSPDGKIWTNDFEVRLYETPTITHIVPNLASSRGGCPVEIVVSNDSGVDTGFAMELTFLNDKQVERTEDVPDVTDTTRLASAASFSYILPGYKSQRGYTFILPEIPEFYPRRCKVGLSLDAGFSFSGDCDFIFSDFCLTEPFRLVLKDGTNVSLNCSGALLTQFTKVMVGNHILPAVISDGTLQFSLPGTESQRHQVKATLNGVEWTKEVVDLVIAPELAVMLADEQGVYKSSDTLSIKIESGEGLDTTDLVLTAKVRLTYDNEQLTLYPKFEGEVLSVTLPDLPKSCDVSVAVTFDGSSYFPVIDHLVVNDPKQTKKPAKK